MTVTYEQILMVVGGASTITTGIFWGAYLLGKLVGRIDRLEEHVQDHDADIRHLKRQLGQRHTDGS